MSNGYPMAAIIGRADVMDAAQKSFISSTYWTERSGPAAALATIAIMERDKVPDHLIKIGNVIREHWENAAAKNGLNIHTAGMDPVPHFGFKTKEPLVTKTLFTQLMLDQGFLASTAFYASYAHKTEHVEAYAQSVDKCFKIIAKAERDGTARQLLIGPVCHSSFKRLTD
jgi:glutamate-1-semialdehyde aminotransferase